MPISSRRRSSGTRFRRRSAGAVALAPAASGARSAGARRSTACGRTAMRCGRASSDGEQRRFMRHARPWWDVHRHRIAPRGRASRSTADRRGAARDGRRADSARCADAEGGARRRDPPARQDQRDRRALRLMSFNCTGPLRDRAQPAIRCCGPARRWDCRARSLGIGLEVDDVRASPAESGCGRWAADQGPLLGDHRGARYSRSRRRRSPRISRRSLEA